MRVQKLVDEGGVKSPNFWKITKNLKQDSKDEYDLITEEGFNITDPEKAKIYIANYYANH